ncbi:hypothetical protein [Streptomyces olivochromogenes]|uniref:hypothetical protein n=1 Tax=Streptomyces olivochromogenes TaxID=1963 RepID=UPI001F47915B|nr:hypothetical protein [Streptomyces olivochromogenes]MCF3131123.1 hypothetical protein [Streptomyces olivochromogenes]
MKTPNEMGELFVMPGEGIGGDVAEWSTLLSELARERGAELNQYGFLLCGDRAEAADLVQEALVRVLRRQSGMSEGRLNYATCSQKSLLQHPLVALRCRVLPSVFA